MDADFCVDALEEAISRYGAPDIFNTDQGSQFTSDAFTGVLKEAGIKISMDGKGRWVDNVFVERLWRSLKAAGKTPAVAERRYDPHPVGVFVRHDCDSYAFSFAA